MAASWPGSFRIPGSKSWRAAICSSSRCRAKQQNSSSSSLARRDVNLPAPILGPPSRLAPSLARSPTDLERSRDLARIKIVATALLAFSVVVAFAARFLESRHWSLGYVAAWAEAAAVGGLADWYAVVALFRHPCGIPLPHTAIISSNRERIAESFGDFVEEQFLAPDPIEQKLESVDFAAAAADWLADEERSLSLSRFALRLLPQALSAVEETGLQSFMARHVVEQIEALEVAPLAARLMSAFVEDQRHQRIFDEILTGLDRLLQDEQTQEAVREKIRGELPSLFNLFRADAYVLRRLITLISNFIHEAQSDPDHALRQDFDRFVADFVEKLDTLPEYADRAETLKRELLARPEIRDLAEDLWQSVKRFLETDARSDNSILEFHLGRFLTDLGRKLARAASANRNQRRYGEGPANFRSKSKAGNRAIHHRSDPIVGRRSDGQYHRAEYWPGLAIHPPQRNLCRRPGRFWSLCGRARPRIALARHGEGPTQGRTVGPTREEGMTKQSQSFVDIVRQFGSDLGLPKVDVDKLVETHRKNFEALTQTALVASDGLKSLATKQKEMVESAFREALDMARNFKPSGDPQQILAKQGEIARKAFDAAIDHTKQIADQVSKSQAEALKIASDRIVASIAELRASFEKAGGADKPKS